MNILERLEKNSSEQRPILYELFQITQSMGSEFTFTFHGHYDTDRYSLFNESEDHDIRLAGETLVFRVPGEQSQEAIEFLAKLNNKIGEL